MFNCSVNLRGTAQLLYSLLYKFNFWIYYLQKFYSITSAHERRCFYKDEIKLWVIFTSRRDWSVEILAHQKAMQIQMMPSGGRSLKSFYEASTAVEMSINSIISIMMQ